VSVKVSVFTTTYNHGSFIAQAMDSVLAQRTSFPFEHIVGEDCSTDGTRDIVAGYQQSHPGIVRAILREHNVGRRRNFVECLQACQGTYVAILEGDDYWTAPHKLQHQADFLDAHPELAICFHAVARQIDGRIVEPAPQQVAQGKSRYTVADLLQGNFIATCTVMFRNRLFAGFPDWYATIPAGDWPLHILNAMHGDIGYLPEVMAVHRTHGGGVWSHQGVAERRLQILHMLRIFRDNLPPQYRKQLERSIARWHFKTINALALEGRRREAMAYAARMVARPDVPRRELLYAAGWAARNKVA
jgi:glycosyltransferase involved in cell wall biosynthesis